MPRNPSYLMLSRHGIFYFRWPLSTHQQPGRSPTTLKVSLRTREPRTALRLARQFSYVAELITQQARAGNMRFVDMQATLHRHFSTLLEARRRQRDDDGPLGSIDIAALETGLSVAEGAVAGKNSLGLIGEDDDLMARFIERYSLPLEPGTADYQKFRNELHHAHRAFCQTALDENRTLSRYDYSAPAAAPLGHSTARPVSLSEAVQKFIADGLRKNRWAKRSEDQTRQHLDLLEKLIGADTDIRTITNEKAHSVHDTLYKLPRNMNKNPETRGKSLEAVLETTHSNVMTVRTVNRYLHTYKSLFAWAIGAGLFSTNPFTKLVEKETKKNTNRKQPFAHEQLRRIESALLTDNPKQYPKSSHKLATLIAIYTGARLNEICQLTINDIKEHEGIECFDFNEDGEGKRLKNEASQRVVPIHSRLNELGLMEYVQELRASKGYRLFPDYSYTKNYGWGKNLSVWLNNSFLPRLDLKTEQLTFHSLRHTMSTRLMQADVPDAIVKAILGHTQQGVTYKHYFDAGHKKAQLRDAIEKFK